MSCSSTLDLSCRGIGQSFSNARGKRLNMWDIYCPLHWVDWQAAAGLPSTRRSISKNQVRLLFNAVRLNLCLQSQKDPNFQCHCLNKASSQQWPSVTAIPYPHQLPEFYARNPLIITTAHCHSSSPSPIFETKKSHSKDGSCITENEAKRLPLSAPRSATLDRRWRMSGMFAEVRTYQNDGPRDHRTPPFASRPPRSRTRTCSPTTLPARAWQWVYQALDLPRRWESKYVSLLCSAAFHAADISGKQPPKLGHADWPHGWLWVCLWSKWPMALGPGTRRSCAQQERPSWYTIACENKCWYAQRISWWEHAQILWRTGCRSFVDIAPTRGGALSSAPERGGRSSGDRRNQAGIPLFDIEEASRGRLIWWVWAEESFRPRASPSFSSWALGGSQKHRHGSRDILGGR